MQSRRTLALLPLAILTLVALCDSGWAQTTATVDWERLRPEGEEFGILMPKQSTAEVSKDPYHKMTLTKRLYLWTSPSGPVFAVVSMSGIKANPALYTEMERVNSYVDAFKRWFPAKVRPKETVAKLTLVKEKTLNGHGGREYQMAIADLSGRAQVYATRKRFYAVVALNTKKDEALINHFVSSFELPERMNETPSTIASEKAEKQSEQAKMEQEIPPNFQGQKPDIKPEAKAAGDSGTIEGSDAKAEHPPTSETPSKRAPISGGVLNGKATSLPPPEYPAVARQARASGSVVVQVTIDEYGNVIAARAVSGHPLLQAAAVAAAQQAKFSPTFMMGEAVKVTGVLTYNFAVQ